MKTNQKWKRRLKLIHEENDKTKTFNKKSVTVTKRLSH